MLCCNAAMTYLFAHYPKPGFIYFVPSVVDKVPRTLQRGNWVLLARDPPTIQSAQFSVVSFGPDFLPLTRQYSGSLDLPSACFPAVAFLVFILVTV
jgi:hypothetical protein